MATARLTARVFVYGTLKRGEANHGLIAPFVLATQTGEIKGFTLFSNGLYPGARPEHGGRIRGELLTVRAPARVFELLDELEGHPGFYRRTEVTVHCENDRVERAWTYLLAIDVSGWQRMGESWADRANGKGMNAEETSMSYTISYIQFEAPGNSMFDDPERRHYKTLESALIAAIELRQLHEEGVNEMLEEAYGGYEGREDCGNAKIQACVHEVGSSLLHFEVNGQEDIEAHTPEAEAVLEEYERTQRLGAFQERSDMKPTPSKGKTPKKRRTSPKTARTPAPARKPGSRAGRTTGKAKANGASRKRRRAR